MIFVVVSVKRLSRVFTSVYFCSLTSPYLFYLEWYWLFLAISNFPHKCLNRFFILHKNRCLNFFFLFFNFTILYWFCHISTWICHRYTRVPHPEPSSLLPPRTIPLGPPSAPAPSIQYPASNLDWWLVSYTILYMFQCHFPKSSHPLPLPQSPKDCSNETSLNISIWEGLASFKYWIF